MGRNKLRKKIITETGLRDISALRKRYPKAEIYFHQDLDGVTTAIAMKKYLENNGITVIDSHIIQYGDKEFAVKKNDAEGDVMPVLVDFAHGKPMFKIHTDHHDKQIGVEKETSKQFRGARSNVETISQIVSPKELFPSSDILLINTVDSADFAKHNITPQEVVNYIFRLDKEKSLQKNKILLGLVINKLLLAFKNRRGFLENLVMNSEPSLLSILNNIKVWMKQTGVENPEQLQKHSQDYGEKMKTYPDLKISNGIIYQYGGGDMRKAGSYDRYTAFRNNPEADFLIMVWPMGLVQASCNPFKKERGLKGVNLGEIAQEVISRWEEQLKNKMVPLSTIKWISETAVTPESVGFTFKDFLAIYGNKFSSHEKGEDALEKLKTLMVKPFSELTEEEKNLLDKIQVNAWDIIQANSGGHKCITNISGLNYLGRSTRPPKGNYKYNPEREDAPYLKFTKMVAEQFQKVLEEKIMKSSESEKIEENFEKPKKIQKINVTETGDVNYTPGINFTINDNQDQMGHVNLLNFYDSIEFDYDLYKFLDGEHGFFDNYNTVYLHDLKVFEPFRGRGLGNELMNICHEFAKKFNFDYITLITNCDNEVAQNLYRKLGYEVYKTDNEKDLFYKKLNF